MSVDRFSIPEWRSLGVWLVLTGAYGYWSLRGNIDGVWLVAILLSWVVMLVLAWWWSRERLFIGLMVVLMWLSPVFGPVAIERFDETMSMSLSWVLVAIMGLAVIMNRRPVERITPKWDWILLGLSGVFFLVFLRGADMLPRIVMWWWQFVVLGYMAWNLCVYVKERWLAVVMILGVSLVVMSERLVAWIGGLW